MEASVSVPMMREGVESALSCLSGGGATDGNIIKEAEHALLGWEDANPSLQARVLLSIVRTAEGEKENIRLGALLTIKALMGRRWRSRYMNHHRRQQQALLLDDATKQEIRSALHSMLSNPSSVRTLQAVTASILAKLVCAWGDSLSDWMTLLVPLACSTSLTSMEHTSSTLSTSANASGAMEAMLGEFCTTKRLLVDKQASCQTALTHVPTLANEWQSCCRLQQQTLHNPVLRKHVLQLTQCLHHWFQVALPNLVQQHPHIVTQSFTLIHDELSRHLLTISENDNDETLLLLEELCEFVVDVQEAHPMAFGPMLAPFLKLFASQLFWMDGTYNNNSSNISVLDRLRRHVQTSHDPIHTSLRRPPDCVIVAALQFLAHVTSCSEYSPDPNTNDALAALQSETDSGRTITARGDAVPVDLVTIQAVVHTVWVEFLTPSTFLDLILVTIGGYMTLSSVDIDTWQEDPESYFWQHQTEGSSSSSNHDLTLAAEQMYCALVEGQPATWIPHLVQLLGLGLAQREAASNGTPEDLLLWDSIYLSTGLLTNLLDQYGGSEWDFLQWYESILGPHVVSALVVSKEHQQHSSNASGVPVLRRRVVWLLGCIANRLSKMKDVQTFFSSMIQYFLLPNDQNDLCVRLTMVEAMNAFIYAIDYNEAGMAVIRTFATMAIDPLYELFSQCDELESQSMILSCISLILSTAVGICAEGGISSNAIMTDSVANSAVRPLSNIWSNASGQKAILRREALTILSCIASGVQRQQVVNLYPLVLPMIDDAINPANTDENSFLMEDAFSLWLGLLRLSTPGDMSTASQLDALYKRAPPALERGLEHVKVLMLISESYILYNGVAFLNKHADTLIHVLKLVVGQVRPRGVVYIGLVLEALLRGFPVEGGMILARGGILTTMLESCAANICQERECEPDRVMVVYLTAMARILVASPHALNACFPMSSLSYNTSFGPRQLVEMFLNLFPDPGDDSCSGLRRKLWIMALLSFLPPTSKESIFSQPTLECMDQLMTESYQFLSKQDGENVQALSVGYDSEEESVVVGQTIYDSLTTNAMLQDPIVTLDLRSFFQQKMQGLPAVIGIEAHANILSTVEPTTLVNLQKLLVGNSTS